MHLYFCVCHFTQVARDDNWHLKAPLTLINLTSSFILYISQAGTLQRVCVQRVEIISQASVRHFLSLLILIQNVFPERKNKLSQVKKKKKFWTLFKLEKGWLVVFYNLKSLI